MNFISNYKDPIKSISLLFLLFISCSFLIFIPKQSDFTLIAVGYALSFAAYLLFIKEFEAKYLFYGLLAGVLIRLILLFAFPNLSDDVYRFIWDGRLIHAGISPYLSLPSEVVAQSIPGLDQGLFDLLNSPGYYSIYPPVSQAVFYLATVGSSSPIGANLSMKIVLLLIELMGFYYLIRLLVDLYEDKELAFKTGMLFFLNPLLIVECVGNIHFEGMMLSLLAIALYFLNQSKLIRAAFFLALSIGTKLIPIVLLPYILIKLKGRERRLFFISSTFFTVAIFAPFLLGLEGNNFLESIDLYFRKFEFNASIYYLLRAIGYLWYGYNKIAVLGPVLAFIVLLWSIWYLLFKDKKEDLDIKELCKFGLFTLTLFYASSTTIHPWYITNLIFLSLFVGLRYPILWSYLITWTYINYSYVPYTENMWIVFVEYFVLFVFIVFELKCSGRRKTIPNN